MYSVRSSTFRIFLIRLVHRRQNQSSDIYTYILYKYINIYIFITEFREYIYIYIYLLWARVQNDEIDNVETLNSKCKKLH